MHQIRIREAEGPNGIRTLHLEGPLTLQTLFDFQRAVRAQQTAALIISLAGVPYMDSAGLGAILGAYVSCHSHGHRFALTDVPPRVFTLLRVVKVDTLVPQFETVGAAEAEFAPKAEGA
jgi:anti-sigma B factor antagonist